jgi:hypothetical protein
VLSFADVVDFFADELPRLGRRRFSFTFVFARPFQCFFFWHDILLSRFRFSLETKAVREKISSDRLDHANTSCDQFNSSRPRINRFAKE